MTVNIVSLNNQKTVNTEKHKLVSELIFNKPRVTANYFLYSTMNGEID